MYATTPNRAQRRDPVSEQLVICGITNDKAREAVFAYRGFHQSLYGLECMCARCLLGRYEESHMRNLPRDVFNGWWVTKCGDCGSVLCSHLYNHGLACQRDWDECPREDGE